MMCGGLAIDRAHTVPLSQIRAGRCSHGVKLLLSALLRSRNRFRIQRAPDVQPNSSQDLRDKKPRQGTAMRAGPRAIANDTHSISAADEGQPTQGLSRLQDDLGAVRLQEEIIRRARLEAANGFRASSMAPSRQRRHTAVCCGPPLPVTRQPSFRETSFRLTPWRRPACDAADKVTRRETES
jgi:hypothetical protein